MTFPLCRRNSGFTIIGVAVAAVIVMLALFGVSTALQSGRKSSAAIRDEQIAEAYAAELLETFRGMTGRELAAYLSVNPYSNTKGPYQLCAHINLLNRAASGGTSQVLLNIDPNVSLGPTRLDGSTPALAANRFYAVQVIDIGTNPPTLKTNYCDYTVAVSVPAKAPAANIYYAPALAANERFLVTVGVSWISKGRAASDPERIVLTTLLPEW